MNLMRRSALALSLAMLLGGAVSAARTQPTTARRGQAAQASRGLSARARADIASLRRGMERDIRDDATPPFEIVPRSDRVRLHQTQIADYDKGTIAKYRISGLGAGGRLSLVTLLPVSGHTGQWQTFARTNRYNLTIEHADGKTHSLHNIRSTGLVTLRELSLRLRRGKTTLQFWPDGSGGVYGYQAGREIELDWGGR
jgi:hypothetical protein